MGKHACWMFKVVGFPVPLQVMPTFVEQVAVGMRGTASSGLPLAVYRSVLGLYLFLLS